MRTRSTAINQALEEGATLMDADKTTTVSFFRPSAGFPGMYGHSVAFQSSVDGEWHNTPWILWNHESTPVGAYPIVAPGDH